MTRFTTDNTEGYTEAQLRELNEMFELLLTEAGNLDASDTFDGSTLDRLAEEAERRVQAAAEDSKALDAYLAGLRS